MKSGTALQLSLLPDLPALRASEKKAAAEKSRLGLTFRDSKGLPVHRWYPYVEGFSAAYLREQILRAGQKDGSVYDPFGGSGTVNLAASQAGISNFFSETNPFMRFVAETKVNARFEARGSEKFLAALQSYRKFLNSDSFAKAAKTISLKSYQHAFEERDFFAEHHLRQLLVARDHAIHLGENSAFIRDLLLLAVASTVVMSSNMTRRADLRRRRENEYVERVVDVPRFILGKLEQIERDIVTSSSVYAPANFVNEDARQFNERYLDSFSLILTSPPYVNGTNYIRNTKLELWFLSFIRSEAELSELNKKSIVCGINNVRKSRQPASRFDFVERVASKLDEVSPDRRIPALIRGYCSDMSEVLSNCRAYLRLGGRMVLDIGDSQFYGVHVPTDQFVEKIAQTVGFSIEERRILARRHSHDKTQLQQVELVLRPTGNGPRKLRPARAPARVITKTTIAEFERVLPHTSEPYAKRNWGHPFHSLCSYQGKLKPSLAHWIVRTFTRPQDLILDPLGGVGTIAFEAALQGRRAISSDLSPLPAIVAAGKLKPPPQGDVATALETLAAKLRQTELSSSDCSEADFGLNATVRDYFHPDTLSEILSARKVFLTRKDRSQAETFVLACLLHILHGNRPYALSRRSHPITPFNPTGSFEYRSLVTKLGQRCERLMDIALPSSFTPGTSFNLDFRHLKERVAEPVDVIITSPPFHGMRFDRPNWMRLWFCGWRESDFHTRSRAFLERQQLENFDVYGDFFASCASLLRAGGAMILHVGGSKSYDMLENLKRLAQGTFSFIGQVSEDVSALEKHGLRDKGLTDKHHLLFFQLS